MATSVAVIRDDRFITERYGKDADGYYVKETVSWVEGSVVNTGPGRWITDTGTGRSVYAVPYVSSLSTSRPAPYEGASLRIVTPCGKAEYDKWLATVSAQDSFYNAPLPVEPVTVALRSAAADRLLVALAKTVKSSTYTNEEILADLRLVLNEEVPNAGGA